jgi:glyoxylase-like metal-dependent hydrolase (beta-lactamase superfamily II)
VPGAAVIHPPTVPPEFDPAAWERSIDRLLSLDPPLLLLAHFGPYTDTHSHLEELHRRLREWTDVVRAGLAAGRTPEEMGTALRQRDATRPGTSPEGVHRLDLVAGHGMSVAGIARYLSRR